MPETIRLLGSTKSELTKDKNGENVLRLEFTEVALVYSNTANNDYQQSSWVLYTFVPDKSLCKSLVISLKNFIYLKAFNSEFSNTEVWFTDQNSKPLQTEDKIKITLVIN